MRPWTSSHPSNSWALVDADSDTRLTYGELDKWVGDVAADLLARPRHLVCLAMDGTIESVALYLACLEARFPVLLPEPLASAIDGLSLTYKPRYFLLPASLRTSGTDNATPIAGCRHYGLREDKSVPDAVLHRELALLLTTSGSTGSPKLVRLSLNNISSNASAIASYLAIKHSDRAISSLPLHYSYGLSVVNSHLFSGACVVLTQHSFLRPGFWKTFDDYSCTSFAGVPYMYETLHRLRWAPARHPTLRTLTQAGGRMRDTVAAYFCEQALLGGVNLFVMYGQTEATARISFVPPDRLREKIGSIGVAIPGGTLTLDVDGGAHRELIYRGPNVMMGYAESPADLARGDELNGTLRTGDIGTVDTDGFFYIVGRLKRFAKLFGRRISLDDVERMIESNYPVEAIAVSGDERLRIFAETHSDTPLVDMRHAVASWLRVPPVAIEVASVPRLPRNAAGKKSYGELE